MSLAYDRHRSLDVRAISIPGGALGLADLELASCELLCGALIVALSA